jgi:hypothetical protein
MELSQQSLNDKEESKKMRETEDKNLNLKKLFQRLSGQKVI